MSWCDLICGLSLCLSNVDVHSAKDKQRLLRTLSKLMNEINRNIYACFIDYTKAFDKVRHA